MASSMGWLGSVLPARTEDFSTPALRAELGRVALGVLLSLAVHQVMLVRIANAQLAPNTERLSVSSSGSEANAASRVPAVSADGRYVAFESEADNLTSDDTRRNHDIFVRDRLAATTARVSVSSTAQEAKGDSVNPAISANGNLVAFESLAWNLVDADTNNVADIFVHDRTTGMTERVSVTSAGGEATGPSFGPSISGDGRYVAFESYATNLGPASRFMRLHIFVHDRLTHTTTLASATPSGDKGNSDSFDAALAADGQVVAFTSYATDLLAPRVALTRARIYARDLRAGTTDLVSAAIGSGANDGKSVQPAISADGRFVSFTSQVGDLVAPFGNDAEWNIYVRDRQLAKTELVTRELARTLPCPPEPYSPCEFSRSNRSAISGDGRFVTFVSTSKRLATGDTSGGSQIYIYDRQSGVAQNVSTDPTGIASQSCSDCPAIATNAGLVAYKSSAANLIANDFNLSTDVFASPTPGRCSSDADCNDGNTCRNPGTCDLATQTCNRTAKPNGAACQTGSGVTCSQADSCLDGSCSAGGGGDVDGDRICNLDDTCPRFRDGSQANVDGDDQGDPCDQLDGPLVLRSARVLARSPRVRSGGVITIKGEMTTAPGERVTAPTGITLQVDASEGLHEPRSLSEARCRSLRDGHLLCRDSGQASTSVRLRLIPSNSDGSQRWSFELRLTGANVSIPVTFGLIGVRLSYGGIATGLGGVPFGIDREGHIAGCRNRRWGIVCSGLVP